MLKIKFQIKNHLAMKSFLLVVIAVLLFACSNKEKNRKVVTIESKALSNGGGSGSADSNTTPLKSTRLNADSGMIWVDYRIGELSALQNTRAVDSAVRKWKINYKRIEGGDTDHSDAHLYEQSNQAYFKSLEGRFGKDWRIRFDKEVATLEQEYRKAFQRGQTTI